MKLTKTSLKILQSASWSDFTKGAFNQASVNKLVRMGLLIPKWGKWVTWYSLTDAGKQVLIDNNIRIPVS